VIYKLSLLLDRMIVPHLYKGVNLISKDRYKNEKKDYNIIDLISSDKTVRFEIIKVSNSLL